MTTSRAFWDAIDQAKRKRREAEADDVEMGDYDDEIGDELADREDHSQDYKKARGVVKLDEPSEVIIGRGRGR